jgi:predicted secreted hydrolase
MAKLKWLLVLLFTVIVALTVWQSIDMKTAETSSPLFGRNAAISSDKKGRSASPHYRITWPDDHMAHDNFDIEWWYITANLEDETKHVYGLQWTLFRFKNPASNSDNTWSNEYLYMAHASIHSMNEHWFSEKFAREGVGNSAVNNDNGFVAFIDDWRWENTQQSSSLFPSQLVFNANQAGQKGRVSAHLQLVQTGPLILHGEQGYSIKSSDGKHASHYYSAPFIDVNGTFTFTKNGVSENLRVSGNAWYDHEWTSQLVDDAVLGWDWLSLHLHDDSKIMAFRMRLADQTDFITGTFVKNDGTLITLSSDSFNLEEESKDEVNGKMLPLRWKLNIPEKQVDLRIQALKEDQFNQASVPYYEGMVKVTGSHSGRGFLELTGY